MSQARRQADQIDKEFEAHIEAYVSETGDHQWTIPKVAAWIYDNRRGDIRRDTAVRAIIRRLRKVAGRARIIDPVTKRPVRKYLPVQLGNDQPMLWCTPEDMDGPEQMKESVKVWRRGIATRVFLGVDTVAYYNRTINPGDPVVFDPDFTKDVEDRQQPTLYDDTPPDDDETPEA